MNGTLSTTHLLLDIKLTLHLHAFQLLEYDKRDKSRAVPLSASPFCPS